MEYIIGLYALYGLLAGYLAYLVVDSVVAIKTIKHLNDSLKEIKRNTLHDAKTENDKSRKNG